MSSVLSRLAPPEGARHKERRLGRGPGSGVGKMSGRGFKGQKARQPGNLGKMNFQGGQTPIQRRLPKRGFRNPLADIVVNINVGELEAFSDGAEVNATTLHATRLVRGRYDVLKVLAQGELTKKLTVHAHRFSKGAVEKIEKAGGKAVVLAPPAPRAKSAETASKKA